MPSEITDVLTRDEWAAARAKYEAGTHSYQNLGDEMKISKAYVARIGKKEAWLKPGKVNASTPVSTKSTLTSAKKQLTSVKKQLTSVKKQLISTKTQLTSVTVSAIVNSPLGDDVAASGNKWLQNKPSVMMLALTNKEEEIMADVADGKLMIAWLRSYDGREGGAFTVPRSELDAIAADASGAWAAFRRGFEGALFVDLNRTLLPAR